MGEPPTKRPRTNTNYKLCIKCQKHSSDLLRQHPKYSSYEKFLHSVRRRADLGELEFLGIHNRLGDITAEQLKDQHAKWHAPCYAETTNVTDIGRSSRRYETALATQDSTQLKRKRGRPRSCSSTQSSSAPVRCTRSQIRKFNKAECFFCQGKNTDILHRCQSQNVGEKMAVIVQKCNNDEWKVNYSELINSKDPLSRDLMYHNTCLANQWKKYNPVKQPVAEKDQKDSDDW